MTRVSEFIECFPTLLRLHAGDTGTEVSKPAPPSAPEPGCVLFLHQRALIGDAVHSPASVLVLREADVDHEALAGATQTLLLSPNPELALALVAKTFFPVTVYDRGFDDTRVHPSAAISRSARIADDVIVGPNAVIGANVTIGAGCIIGANSTIEDNTRIDAATHIHANVFIAHGTVIGKRCEIHPMSALGTEGFGYTHDERFNHYRHVHYGALVIEDDVHIGACVTIDRGHFVDSVIGGGTRIDDHCHLGHNIRVGRNSLMAGGSMAAGSATIGANNVFGGRCCVNDHVTTGDNMRFAGLTSIMKDMHDSNVIYAGDFRLQPIEEYLKSKAVIPHLPRMRRNITRIMRKLGMQPD